MTYSFSQTTSLTCPDCGQSFTADIWLVVDASERPDLLKSIQAGALHDLPCPHCGHNGQVDAPLLLYRPGDMPPLVFSPAQRTTEAQDREQAQGLLGYLHDVLGSAWRDEWLAAMPAIPRHFLPAALSDDPKAALRQAAEEAMPPALREVLAELAQSGVVINSQEELERALAARPDLQAKLAAALGGGPDVPPQFQADIRQAQTGEQRYVQRGDRRGLDEAAAAWERILQHPTFPQSDDRFQLAAYNDGGGVFLRRYRA